MRRGAVVSLIAQTGHSDDSHSPDEWARTVVRRIHPASLSIEVVCTVAISCPPGDLRTISRPAGGAAWRWVCSLSRGCEARMGAVRDFAGLASSDCALASAAAIAPIVSLARCMARLPIQKIEADRAGLRAFGPNPVASRFLGVLGHQPFQFDLGALVFEEGGAGRSEQACDF